MLSFLHELSKQPTEDVDVSLLAFKNWRVRDLDFVVRISESSASNRES